MLLMQKELSCCFIVLLPDDASSKASVHDDYGVLTASIAMKNDTYIIEVNIIFCFDTWNYSAPKSKNVSFFVVKIIP